jgi:hypothetical protein
MAEVYIVMGTADGWVAGWFKRTPETLAWWTGRRIARRMGRDRPNMRSVPAHFQPGGIAAWLVLAAGGDDGID